MANRAFEKTASALPNAARPSRHFRHDPDSALLTSGAVSRYLGLLAGHRPEQLIAPTHFVQRNVPRWSAAVVEAWSPPISVYFIARDDTREVKIGLATDPRARLQELQVAHGEPLRLIMSVFGERCDEARLHRLFRRLRKRGEWFRLEGDLDRFIAGSLRRMARGLAELEDAKSRGASL